MSVGQSNDEEDAAVLQGQTEQAPHRQTQAENRPCCCFTHQTYTSSCPHLSIISVVRASGPLSHCCCCCCCLCRMSSSFCSTGTMAPSRSCCSLLHQGPALSSVSSTHGRHAAAGCGCGGSPHSISSCAIYAASGLSLSSSPASIQPVHGHHRLSSPLTHSLTQSRRERETITPSSEAN